VFYATALVLRNFAKGTLAQQWSLQIEIQPKHHIVRSGPFAYIRHAAYLAIMLEVLGIPMVSNAYRILMFVSIPYIIFIFWRAALEENALIRATGWEYIKYKAETGAFLPWRIGLSCHDRRSNDSTSFQAALERRQTERRRTKMPLTFRDRRRIVRKNEKAFY
jgi:hypothetical protein